MVHLASEKTAKIAQRPFGVLEPKGAVARLYGISDEKKRGSWPGFVCG